MTKIAQSLIALLAGCLVLLAGADYKLLTSYPVPGTGTFDYITVDGAARRLYVSHQTKIEVLDADTGKAVGAIEDTPGVHGALIVPKLNRGFTTNGAENTLSMFDTKTLKLIKKIEVGKGPDSFFYDAGSGRVFVANHGTKEITAVDPAGGAVLGTIPVGGGGEQMGAGKDGLMYVNIEELAEVLVFDPKTLEVKHHFPIQGCTQPAGLAVDTKYDRLFIGCASKVLVVMDAHNGKVITSMPIGARNDDAWFDPEGRMIFASTGEGKLYVFHQKSADEYEDAGAVTTEVNAKTSAFDPKTKKIYLIAGEIETIPPADPGQRPTRKVKDGTFKVLVVGK